MSKIILLLAIIFASNSTLFASKNKPIYTVKDNKVHMSTGKNQSECNKYRAVATTSDGRDVYYESKCNKNDKKCNKNDKNKR